MTDTPPTAPVTSTVRIPANIVKRLDAWREPLGLPRSQAMWALLDEALMRHELAAETRARIVRAQGGAAHRGRAPLHEDGLPHD